MDEMMERQNPFCVISKETYGEHKRHDIQTNSGWSANPYGEDYAVVPDEMVDAICETGGYCDIELNEDGTEIVSFTALEKPVIPNEQKVIAPRNIVAGEYVTINGVLYLATENIPNGEPVIAGQNATITTIEEQLRELKGE